MIKPSRNELAFLLLSVALLGLFTFIYLTQSKRHYIEAPKQSQISRQKKVSEDPQLAEWLKKLEEIEASPTLAAVAELTAAYNQLTDSSEKSNLKERLTALEEEVKRIATAEELLIVAETSGLQTDIDQAQTAITAIKTDSSKEPLQTRLSNLIDRLHAQVTPAPEPAPIYTQPEVLVETIEVVETPESATETVPE